jgi:ATP-dependent Clp protease ATP-binding subunit ClpA
MSLREALRMGHNYIGTEHVLLGVLRATSDRDTVRQVLGVGSDEIRARVLEVMAKGPTPEAPQSPALAEVLKRARELSGSATMTTGHLLQAMVADNSCQAAQALEMLGVNAESVEARLATVPVARTSDAPPRPRAVEIKLGQLTTTIDDPDLAGALGQLTAEQLAAALRGAVAGNTEPPATEPPASEPPASEPPASAAS